MNNEQKLRIATEALEVISKSMMQAKRPGNDRLRELDLSFNTAQQALSILAAPQHSTRCST